MTQSEAEAFLKWLDTRNEFSSSFQRKFTLVPTGEDDFGFLGNVKPVATDDIDVWRIREEERGRERKGERGREGRGREKKLMLCLGE